MELQFDRISLKADKLVETDMGLRAQVVFASAGTLEYPQLDGSVQHQIVNMAVLSDPEYLNDMKGSAVTLLHPKEFVTPDNVQRFAVGAILDAYPNEKEQTLDGVISIFEKEAIAAVKNKITTSLSQGYGVIKEKENEDVFRQTKRKHNHTALVPEGRDKKASIQYDARTWFNLNLNNKKVDYRKEVILTRYKLI